ncbi:MAG: (2Fe-2S)-binding protein [Acidimicrobiales bacterium]
MNLRYALLVNGAVHEVEDAWLGESLLNVLRDRLDLPGTKNACEEGECGSCSVKLDGTLVCSCLVLAASAVGSAVETVEAQEHDGALSAVQAAFVDEGAVQCGFCTPGLVMAVDDLLDRSPTPTDLEIREAISGNLCRCTGYGRVIEAIRVAARQRSDTGD